MSRNQIIEEIEFALSLIDPPPFRVRMKLLSLEKGWFSGIWAEYKPKYSKESINIFIPHNELKKPYSLRSVALSMIKKDTYVTVFPLKVELTKNCWPKPIFSMFSLKNRGDVIEEAEEIKLTNFNEEEINIKKDTLIKKSAFEISTIGAEHYPDQERIKSITFRVTTQSQYPVLRGEQEKEDLKRWQKLKEHNNKKSSITLKRFFYSKYKKNKFKIGDIEITLLPFFSKKEREEMYKLGYFGKLKIIYPRSVEK